jgi:predicted transposase YbfD/YdcC
LCSGRWGGGKSNEITAIPKLLAMLAIEGAIVTIDAMGSQRDIAWTIIDKKADGRTGCSPGLIPAASGPRQSTR